MAGTSGLFLQFGIVDHASTANRGAKHFVIAHGCSTGSITDVSCRLSCWSPKKRHANNFLASQALKAPCGSCLCVALSRAGQPPDERELDKTGQSASGLTYAHGPLQMALKEAVRHKAPAALSLKSRETQHLDPACCVGTVTCLNYGGRAAGAPASSTGPVKQCPIPWPPEDHGATGLTWPYAGLRASPPFF